MNIKIDCYKSIEIIAGENNYFSYPSGICYNSEENLLYVSDLHNHRVCWINANTGEKGEMTRKVMLNDTCREIGRPLGIAISSRGDLYVTDAITNEILVLNKKLDAWVSVMHSLNEPLNIENGFNLPSGVAIDEYNNIYTNDFMNNRLCRILLDKTIQILIDKNIYGYKDGSKEEALINKPYGIYYKTGKLYIADAGNNAIRVLDINSLEVKSINTTCNIYHPIAITLDNMDNLYICEQRRILYVNLDTGDTKVIIDKDIWKSLMAGFDLPERIGYTGAIVVPYPGLIYWVDTVKGILYKMKYIV